VADFDQRFDTRVDEDHAALFAAAGGDHALCTLVGIDGSFSRRLGAQIAIGRDGSVVGSLADGCLEMQLASDCRITDAPSVRRYGAGSPVIDFRLPCGGGIDVLIDPAPDRAACRLAIELLHARQPAALALPPASPLASRDYIPTLRIVAFGEGPELAAFDTIARAAHMEIDAIAKRDLMLGSASGRALADQWTAIVLLFHDHEWELALLAEALAGEAFYIGAQGGMQARTARTAALAARGFAPDALTRVRSPIGSPAGSRTPHALALAALAEIAGLYELARH
jgi:xanthine dehydrogenase accessory factor